MSLPEKNFNTKVISSLQDFTKVSSANNAVSDFLLIDGLLGCAKEHDITYLSSYVLSSDGVCNADMIANIDVVVAEIKKQNTYTNFNSEELKTKLLAKIKSESQTRYCLIPTELECISYNIIKYEKNLMYYLEALGLSFLVTALISLLLSILYYRGVVYIVFGALKKL